MRGQASSCCLSLVASKVLIAVQEEGHTARGRGWNKPTIYIIWAIYIFPYPIDHNLGTGGGTGRKKPGPGSEVGHCIKPLCWKEVRFIAPTFVI